MRFFLACLASVLINVQAFGAPLVIGTLAYDPPFGLIIDKNGDFSGFDIDLMNTICNRLKETCTYKALTFEQIFDELQSGEINLAIAAISITPERELEFIFSLPYMVSRAQLLANAQTKVQNIKDIQGKKVGVEAGTVFDKVAQEKLGNAIIAPYNTQSDLLQALANNSLELVLLDEATANYLVDNNDGLFKLIGSSITVGQGYGIMANRNSRALITRINQVLIAMENDGTYLAIYKKYF